MIILSEEINSDYSHKFKQYRFFISKVEYDGNKYEREIFYLDSLNDDTEDFPFWCIINEIDDKDIRNRVDSDLYIILEKEYQKTILNNNRKNKLNSI
ncbi:hypothetical protein M0Q50_05175 [bacterium]|jgi:hypothetical protein|nr:hypothetical protein [bacterium]